MSRHLRHEERSLNRAARVAARHGDLGTAVALHTQAASIHNVRVANRVFRRCTYGMGYGIIRRIALARAITRRAIVPLAFATALTDVMIIYDPRINTYRLAEDFDHEPCPFERHTIVQLPDYTEITFQDPSTNQIRVLYADSYCSTCGQHFFIESSSTTTTFTPGITTTTTVINTAPIPHLNPVPPVYYPPPVATPGFPGAQPVYANSYGPPPPYGAPLPFANQYPPAPVVNTVSPYPGATAVVPQGPAKFCTNCGGSVQLNNKFCSSCGHAI